MSSLDDFHAEVAEQFLQVEPSSADLEALCTSLGLEIVDAAEELTEQTFKAFKTPNLLHRLVGRWPSQEPFRQLLAAWEKDANLQEVWAESASAADLQDAKAHYVLASLRADVEDKTVARLLRKISRALADQPDNARGEYEIYGAVRATALLGSGELATVYKGTDLVTGDTVAVKVLNRGLAASEKLVLALINSTQKIQKLRHPQIAAIVEPVRPDERPRRRPFFVMEFCGDGTLEDRIVSDDFSLTERQAAAVRLCQGLSYAHRLGLAHGNLKPSNVLVRADGEIRLSDFLVAGNDETSPDVIGVVKKVCRPYYMAREVVSGQSADARSDIFSLGRLLFRLFTKQPENIYDVMVPQLFKQQLEENLSDYPGLVDVIQRATALLPDDRPANVGEMLAELHRFGGQLGLDTNPEVAELRAEGSWTDLVATRRRDLESLDHEEQVAALEDIANLEEYVLDASQSALETWSQAFLLAPDANLSVLEAELDRLSTDLDTPESARIVAEALTAVLETGRVVDASELLRLQLKAAELFHHTVGDNQAAIPLYLNAIERVPENEKAHSALNELYEVEEDWFGLAELLERRLAILSEDTDRIELLDRLARIQEDQIGDLAESADAYSRIRAIDPQQLNAFTELERLFRELERWEDLAELLEEEIGHGPALDRLLDLQYSLAEVQRLRLDHQSDAVALYQTILAESPEHPGSIGSLEELMAADIEALSAARLLEPIYRRHDSHSKLAGALEVLLRAMEPSEQQWVETLQEIAAIRESREEAPDDAFDVIARLHRGRTELTWAWDELERLAPLCDDARWVEVVGLYHETISTEREDDSPDLDFIVALWLRIGEVQVSHLQILEPAIESYIAITEIEPRHPEALARLEILYEKTEHWRELIDVLDLQKQVHFDAGHNELAVEQMHRIARLWEERLDDPPRAIQTYAAALSIDGDDSYSVEQLERLSLDPEHIGAVSDILNPHYTERQAWTHLLELIERALELDSDLDPAEQATSLVRMAVIVETEVGDFRSAFAYFKRAVRADIEQDDNHDELERVAEQTEAWPEIVAFYDKLLDDGIAQTDERRQVMLMKMAAWHRDRLFDPDAADRCFRAVLEINPEHTEALDALDTLYSERRQYQQLYEILSTKALLTDDEDDQRVILYRMAGLCDEQLDNLALAIEAYQRVVMLGEPEPDALDGLASIYGRQADHPKLLETLQQRAAIEPNVPARITLLTRIGQLATTELNDSVTARNAYEEALLLSPIDPRNILESLANLYLNEDNLEQWYELLAQRLEHALTNDERVALHLQAADLAQRPDAPDSADTTAQYEAVLQFDPYRPEVLLALERDYTRKKRWPALNDVYRRQFIGIHLKAAQVAADFMDDKPRAIAHLAQASDLDPTRIQIIDKLLDLFEQQGEWASVVKLVERKLLLLEEPQEQAQLLRQLAEALERNKEPTRAIQASQRAIEIDPSDLTSLVQLCRLSIFEDSFETLVPPTIEQLRQLQQDQQAKDLLSAIEQLGVAISHLRQGDLDHATAALGSIMRPDGLAPDLALSLIQPAFQRFNAEGALISLLDATLRSPSDDWERRRAMYRAAAELHEQQGEVQETYELYVRFFNEQPGVLTAREQMLRLAEMLGRRDEAIDLIEARLDQGLDDPSLAVDLSLMLGRIFADSAQVERAIGHFRRALELSEDNGEALAALDILYEQQQQWTGLLIVLERRIATTDDPNAKIELKIRLARALAQQFDEPNRLADVCIDVLRSAPDDAKAFRKEARQFLEALAEAHSKPGSALFFRVADVLKSEYIRRRQRDELLALLSRRLELLPDVAGDEARYHQLLELAEVAEDFNDPTLAFDFTAQAIHLVPSEPAPFESLEELAGRLQSWEELINLYVELLSREDITDQEFRLTLALKVADWVEEQLGRPDDAIAAYQFALQIDASNLQAMDALERLYLEQGQLEDLLDLLVTRADQTLEDDARRLLLLRAANLADRELSLPERAIPCYERILDEFGPDGETAAELRSLYETVGHSDALHRTIGVQLDVARDESPDAVPQLLLDRGRLAWLELGDTRGAIDDFTEALDSQTAHDKAMASLAAIYEQNAEWTNLVEHLQAQLPLTVSDEMRLELSLKGARIAREQLQDANAAIILYEEVKEFSPDLEEATVALYELLADNERWTELLPHLENDLERSADDPTTQVATSLYIAEMALDEAKLNDPNLAQHYLGLALELDPINADATRLSVQQYLSSEQVPEALELLEKVIGELSDSQERLKLLLLRGDIYLEHVQDEDEAAKDFDEAFQLDETNTDVAERLARLLSRKQAWTELLDVFDRLANRVSDVDAKVDVALKAAELVEEYDLPRERLVGILEAALTAGPSYPHNTALVLKLVPSHLSLGNLDAAMSLVEFGLAEPNTVANRALQGELWYLKGVIDRAANNADDALIAHETCYRLNNSHILNLIAYARILHDAERWDDAVGILQVALLKQADLSTDQKVDVYFMMGMAWVNKGDRRRARDMFNRVIGIDPNHEPTLNALADL